MMTLSQKYIPLRHERIFFGKNIWHKIQDYCFWHHINLLLHFYFYNYKTMITTSSQYREAIRETQHISLDQVPPFSLPKNSEWSIQVIPVQWALDKIGNSRAGFIGKDTAALIHKIL
jgi:hypothetical protein